MKIGSPASVSLISTDLTPSGTFDIFQNTTSASSIADVIYLNNNLLGFRMNATQIWFVKLLCTLRIVYFLTWTKRVYNTISRQAMKVVDIEEYDFSIFPYSYSPTTNRLIAYKSTSRKLVSILLPLTESPLSPPATTGSEVILPMNIQGNLTLSSTNGSTFILLPNSTVNGSIYIDGEVTLQIGGGTTVNGNIITQNTTLVVLGDILVSGNLTIDDGQIQFNGGLIQAQNANISSGVQIIIGASTNCALRSYFFCTQHKPPQMLNVACLNSYRSFIRY